MNARSWGIGVFKRVALRDVPPGVLALVTERQGGKFCEDCRRLGLVTPPTEPLELDHRQALAAGGDHHHLNLRWTCRGHNRGRCSRPMRATPKAPRWSTRRTHGEA